MSQPNSLPTYETLRKSDPASVLNSIDMLRIRWEPFGPLEKAVVVADDLEAGSDSPESPFKHVTADGTVSYHPVAQSPATEPPVSAITVQIDDLENWAWDWEQAHIDHAEDCDGGPGPDEEVQWSQDIVPVLLRCCGEHRPRDGPTLVVRPSTGEFATVRDYVEQVHAWLQGLKEDILAAREASYGICRGVMPGIVGLYSLDRVGFRDEVGKWWDRRGLEVRRRREGTWPKQGNVYERPESLHR